MIIKRRKNLQPFLWSSLLLILAFLLSIAIGSVFIPPLDFIRLITAKIQGFDLVAGIPESFSAIIFKVRLPHTFLIALTGAALAGSGAVYQGVFRNPLADPYLIGVAAGAGLGAVLMMSLNWPDTLLGMYAIPIAAFAGAMLTVLLVYNLARLGRSVPTTTLILAGVAVSSFATAFASFLMMRSHAELYRAMSWMLGGSSMAGWKPVLAAFPYILIGLGILMLSGHALNVLQFGEEQAQHLGLNVERVKLVLILAASLSTAAAVSFCGLIGFVGLIIPHLVRFIWGPDYRRLVLLAILGGSSFLLLADLLARTVIAPQVLPLGIVTALAGAPFFLWILRRVKSQMLW